MKNKFLFSLFAINIFLGAFLMFLIQPVVAKIITPLYGGASQVWCICLMFFQLTLLAGYGLTFLLSNLKVKKQSIIYFVLLTFSALLIKLPVAQYWAADNSTNPAFSLLSVMVSYLALPAVLLSTVSTMMQNWYRIVTNDEPYKLYSISNIGSMSSLLLYPVFIEPFLSVDSTVSIWTTCFKILAFSLIIVSFISFYYADKFNKISVEPDKSGNSFPSLLSITQWILLSAAGTILLMSFTTHITQEISPVPLLWIIPLSLYLLTFVICFSSEKSYKKSLYIVSPLLLIILTLNFLHPGSIYNLLLNLLLFFALCLFCHQELYKLRPKVENLPVFYFFLSAGGAMGGIFTNLVAPKIFNVYTEFPLIIIMLVGFIGIKVQRRLFSVNKSLSRTFFTLLLLILLSSFYIFTMAKDSRIVLSERNFYGSVKVFDAKKNDRLERTIVNGRIKHGSQYIDKNGNYLTIPTTYYTEKSGINLAIQAMREKKNNKPLKIGIIGLGVGTITALCKEGDEITYFEIDPKIKNIAETQFTYLKNPKPKVNIILGDGRLRLQEQLNTKYDILLVDAFSGDSIPIHLLTKEAFELYYSRTNKDGLIVYHVSNRYLNLNSVVSNIALKRKANGYKVFAKNEQNDYYSLYSIVSKENWLKNYIGNIKEKNYIIDEFIWNSQLDIWTDNFSNLFTVLKGKI